MRDIPGASSNQALARGLHVLRMLVDSGQPMTATEMAARLGLHQSSISRILATLIEVGYVRKTPKGRFAPDYGLLSLASATSGQFPLVTRPREAMEKLSRLCAGYTVSLCMLWNGQMIYFLRTSQHAPTIDFWASDFPLHLSAPGLRMLNDLPREQALALLRASRERHGWRRDSPIVPETESEVLDWVDNHVAHDVLVLPQWHRVGETGAAIPVDADGEPHPLALSISGADRPGVDEATLRLWLHDGRRLVESSLR